MGKTISIPDRDSTYVTGEPEDGLYMKFQVNR
jgi:hypothetical protein